MSWKELIHGNNPVWHGVEAYAGERIEELTQVCVSPESSESDIRQAQAAIAEMRRLRSLPGMIRAEAQIRAQTTRKEY